MFTHLVVHFHPQKRTTLEYSNFPIRISHPIHHGALRVAA